MRKLRGISITFDTHDDNKDDTIPVHVFVMNRLGTTRTPQQHSDYIGNLLELARYQDGRDLADQRNPYLAFGEGLGADHEFEDPSSTTFDLTLTSDAIDFDQIVLPAVSVHITTEGDDRWIFDYSVVFTYVDDTGQEFRRHLSSTRDGLRASSSTRTTTTTTTFSRRCLGSRPCRTGR